MTSPKSPTTNPSGNASSPRGDTSASDQWRRALTAEELRTVDEIDLRLGPDPVPPKKEDGDREGSVRSDNPEFVRVMAATEIELMRRQTPTRARVETQHGVRVEPTDYSAAGYQELMELLGGADVDFIQGVLRQLGTVSTTSNGIDEQNVNFLLSFIKSHKPRDEVEVLLLAQMAVVFQAAMREAQLWSRAGTLEAHESYARSMAQANRTYTAQMGALKHYRTGGEQKVTVQHVSVNDGGRAIVTQVTNAPALAIGPDGEQDRHALPPPQDQPMELVGERACKPVHARKGKRS